MTDQAQLTALVIALSLLAFPAFWCMIVLLLSHVGGWQRLAHAYATDKEPRGTAFRWVSGSLGLVSYNHCLFAHVAPAGLFLSMPFLFRFGHKPLLIPWHAIHAQEEIRFLWYRAVRFEVGAPPIARLRLPAQVFAARRARA